MSDKIKSLQKIKTLIQYRIDLSIKHNAEQEVNKGKNSEIFSAYVGGYQAGLKASMDIIDFTIKGEIDETDAD